MAIKKELVRPARYYPFDPETKKRYPADIAYDRIQGWADKASAMFSKGYVLPISFKHDDAVHPIKKDKIDKKRHAGYIESIELEDDGQLNVLIEPLPGREKQVKNQKISLQNAQSWSDEDGDEYEDCLVHVALTDKPIHRKQKEFEEGFVTIAMADLEDNAIAEGEQAALDLILELLPKLKIELPKGTTRTNFFDRLATALSVLISSTEEEDDAESIDTKPKGAVVKQPARIAMSGPIELSDFIVLKMSEGDNPATKKPWTKEELAAAHAAHNQQFDVPAHVKAAEQRIQASSKKLVMSQIDAAETSGCLDADTAKELKASLQAVTLQFSEDGEIDKSKHGDIFTPLKMAERAGPRRKPEGARRIDHPDDFEGEDAPITDKEAMDNADELLNA